MVNPQIQPNGYIFFELMIPKENTGKKIEEKKINKEENIENKKEKKMGDIKEKRKKEPKISKTNEMEIEEKKEEKKMELELKIVKAQFEQESFELYQKYCKVIHQKEKEKADGYTSFLCEQALEYQSFKSGSEELLCGCYHMKYYFKGKLIAIGVVDIFPWCLSSVYFFYDPDPVYKKLGLGIVSSLKEIEWIKNKQRTFQEFKYYYLGFYIQDCQKMVYKGEYEPSELLCPITYEWVILDENIHNLIDKNDVSSRISQKETQIRKDMNLSNEEIKKILAKVKIKEGNNSYFIRELSAGYVKYFNDAFTTLIKNGGEIIVERMIFSTK